jgi:hypothetical protein
MILIIVVGVLILISAFCIYRLSDDEDDIVTLALGFIIPLILLTFFIVWPIVYYESVVDIERYRAIEFTMSNFRGNENQIESAAMFLQVQKVNQQLAAYRYWNDSIFDYFIVDEITELPFLE